MIFRSYKTLIIRNLYASILAPVGTGQSLPAGAAHSGADFQPLRVELVGAGSFGGIGCGV